jgi:hypothetical protein
MLDPSTVVPVDFRRSFARLAQFRPFGDGAVQVEFVLRQLVLAAAFEAGEAGFPSLAACKDTCETLWGLDVDLEELHGLCGQLAAEGRLVRTERDAYRLTSGARAELLETVGRSQAAESTAFDEWEDTVASALGSLAPHQMTSLREDLVEWLQRIIAHFGVEAALLLYPEDDRAAAFFEGINDLGFDFLPARDEAIEKVRAAALPLFIRRATPNQRLYLSSQMLTAYMVAILTIDPAAERMVAEVTTGQRVYVDTNVLYAALGLKGPRDYRAVIRVFAMTRRLGFELAVTPWTVEEMKSSLRNARRRLAQTGLPPRALADLAAEAVDEDTFVTAYWRKYKETGVTVADFYDLHMQVEGLLAKLQIAVVDEGCLAVDRSRSLIDQHMSLIETVPGGASKSDRVREHDVKHRLLVERLRGDGNRRFSNAGYWFLTRDSVLIPYGFAGRGRDDALPFAVSLSAWAQVVRSFTSRTEDYEQTLVDLLDSPAVRPRGMLAQQTVIEVLARIDLLVNDSTEEVATRMLVDTARMVEIEVAQGPRRVALIDAAIDVKTVDMERQLHETQQALGRERDARAAAEARLSRVEAERNEEADRAESAANSAAGESHDRKRVERELAALAEAHRELQASKESLEASAEQRLREARAEASHAHRQRRETQLMASTRVAQLTERLDRRSKVEQKIAVTVSLLLGAAVVVVPLAGGWRLTGWALALDLVLGAGCLAAALGFLVGWTRAAQISSIVLALASAVGLVQQYLSSERPTDSKSRAPDPP